MSGLTYPLLSISTIQSMQSLEVSIKDILHRGAVSITSEMGTEIIAYCPFHSNMNTPSFSINRYTGLWQCFNPECNQRGGIRLLKKLLLNEDHRSDNHVSESYIDKILNDVHEIKSFEDVDEQMSNCRINYDTADEVLQPLIDRGFDLETLTYFEVGFSSAKSRIVIPARDQFFRLVGLIGRAITNDQIPRYLYSTGFPKSKILYNLCNAKSFESKPLFEPQLCQPVRRRFLND